MRLEVYSEPVFSAEVGTGIVLSESPNNHAAAPWLGRRGRM